VYARTVGSDELTFGVSGMLWRENLVMYDRQTDSWWSQADGVAIQGPKRGAQLEQVASDMMSWKEWRALHPSTVVLAPPGGASGRDQYANYHASRSIGVTGRLRAGGVLDAKTRILGFRLGLRAFAVALDRLSKTPVTQFDAAGQSVVLVSGDRQGARVFLAGNRRFTDAGTNANRPRLRDQATGSIWDALDGRAVSGPQAGAQLERVAAHQSYWFSWYSFFPDTLILEPGK